MTNKQDIKDKLQEYQERYRFWTDKRISQFSFLNNLLLTISLAVMGYFWKERNSVYTELIIDLKLQIEWKIVLFFIGMAILLFSIVAGLFLAISRLYDLRLTSNIVLTRKRALKCNVPIINDNTSINYSCNPVFGLWKIFSKYNQFEINLSEVKANNGSLQQKFTELRQLSDSLGSCTWKLMKCQTVSLLISICCFMAVLLMK